MLLFGVLNMYAVFCCAQNPDSLWVGSSWKKINQGDSAYRDTTLLPVEFDDGRKVEFIVESFITPSYPGGLAVFHQDFANGFKYPSELRTGQSITVMVKFTVNVDGTLSDIKFSKILNPLIDEETKRVIMSMQRWHCGKVNLLKARVRIGVNLLIHK